MFSEADLAKMLAHNSDLMVEAPPAAAPQPSAPRSTRQPDVTTPQPLMTETERRFALDVIEPGVECGEVITYWFEPGEIRMVGQTYTVDWVVITQDKVIFYEIKGKRKLMSEERASVKFNWAAAQFASDFIWFCWAKLQDDGTWKIKRRQPVRRYHPQLKQ